MNNILHGHCVSVIDVFLAKMYSSNVLRLLATKKYIIIELDLNYYYKCLTHGYSLGMSGKH